MSNPYVDEWGMHIGRCNGCDEEGNLYGECPYCDVGEMVPFDDDPDPYDELI